MYLVNKLFLFIVITTVTIVNFVDCNPTSLATFTLQGGFIEQNLTNGVILQNRPDYTNSYFINSLLQCIGDDYIVLTDGYDTQDKHYNLSIYNGVSGLMTTKAQFFTNIQFDFQFNSFDSSSGLAFASICSNSVYPSLAIFNVNEKTVNHTAFDQTSCQDYAYGAYDSSTQIYYIYGNQVGKHSSLTFAQYSLASQTTKYVEIAYNLEDIVQQIFVYQSKLYVCIIQNSYIEVGIANFNSKSIDSIFQFNYSDTGNGNCQFVYDEAGYILALMTNQKSEVNVIAIDLETLQTTIEKELLMETTTNNNTKDEHCKELDLGTFINDIVAVDHHCHNVLGDKCVQLMPLAASFCEGAIDSNQHFMNQSKLESIILDDALTIHYDNKVIEGQSSSWHLQFTKVYKVVRLETILERSLVLAKSDGGDWSFQQWTEHLRSKVTIAPGQLDTDGIEIIGFKSILAYRGGLGVESSPVETVESEYKRIMTEDSDKLASGSYRVSSKVLIVYFLRMTMEISSQRFQPLPIQIHTGYGDSDLDLEKANPLLLKPLIADYPTVPIVLLHCSYPYFREGAFLCWIYPNVYIDIGLAIPLLSQRGMYDTLDSLLEKCIENNEITLEEAKEFSLKIFRENVLKLYNINK
ncbi:amidohydrolase 2 family protein [Heterostelium album PN500]|uniref:Amidohydrolase 2 family protein n=1 Tax=Heterostelium pallidum (strain ATCC 26659 / Pp 5 / PN500) TaxID=670386 RepID=D3B389_HETP5|nr:amidohydrolase 2 family protein [Heterostelium album PN500]EFA83787.1 amidohydrolase 2 family protein [Heterostelium album PN500]|eukprot:XP_020435904.1 amidohydrolase 2 family protein [Heterostelium album PN500]